MVYERYFQRWFTFLLFCGGIVLIVYAIGFLPLSRRAENLQSTLDERRVMLRSMSAFGEDYDAILKAHAEARTEFDAFRGRVEVFHRRFEPDARTRERLRTPFQLVDFEQRRFEVEMEFSGMAYTGNVGLATSVQTNLPRYSLAVENPTFLWAQLEYVRHLLYVAIASDVKSIDLLELLPTRTHSFETPEVEDLREFPVRVKLFGSVESIFAIVQSLPLLPDEISKRNLPAALPGKPALLLDSAVLQRSTEDPDLIEAELVVSGFLGRNPAP